MQFKTPDRPLKNDSFECLVDPQRMKKAVKNARKLFLSPIISEGSDLVSIHIDAAVMTRLNAKCDAVEKEIFKLLLSGYNQTEIAQKLDMSQSNVSRKILKLKKFLP